MHKPSRASYDDLVDPTACFETPALRIGCLVKATVPGTRGKKNANWSFTYSDGERSEALLQAATPEFDQNMRTAAKAAIEKHNIKARINEDFAKKVPLAPAQRGSRMGMVYDFSEFALNWRRETVVLVRGCLTLCVKGASTSAHLDETAETYSKFWLRFFIPTPAAIPVGQQKAVFTAEELRELYVDMEKLADAMLQSMVSPYEKVLRKLSKKPEMNVACGPRIEVLAAASRAADFPNLFSAIRADRGLNNIVRSANADDGIQAAVQMTTLARALIGDGTGDSFSTFVKKHRKNTKFFLYETPRFYRGLFLRRKYLTNRVLLVGLTDSVTLPQDGDAMFNAKMAAPNAVSASLITEIGSLF